MTNRSLVLLSGEPTSIPEAEARAIFLAYDPRSKFRTSEARVLEVDSMADPFVVARRVAFARRVGVLIESATDAAHLVNGKSVRVRTFRLAGRETTVEPGEVIAGIDSVVDLTRPEFEFTRIEGRRNYLALTAPSGMHQGWSRRRPRRRPFFHPSAIFPKLSRALVNLTRVKEGELFLDPFCGTGSLAIEAAEVGARVLALDVNPKMCRGALSNMRAFDQEWMGAVTCDAFSPPVQSVDAIATDVPYGRVASTRGKTPKDVIGKALESAHEMLRSNSLMVLMHAKNQSLDPGAGWSVIEEHDLYVHKFLTRTVTILRRR